jgi:hypothetical protein
MNSHPRDWPHSSHHHPHSNWRPSRDRSRTQLGNPKARRRRLRQCRSRRPPNRRRPHRHRSRTQLAGIVDAKLQQRSRETTGDRRAPGRSRSTARRRAAQTSRRRAGPYTRRSWLRSQSFQGSIASWLFSNTICPLPKSVRLDRRESLEPDQGFLKTMAGCWALSSPHSRLPAQVVALSSPAASDPITPPSRPP